MFMKQSPVISLNDANGRLIDAQIGVIDHFSPARVRNRDFQYEALIAKDDG